MDGSGQPGVRSTCPYCGVGCGVVLRPDGGGGLTVEGDRDHPANRGRLCSKGMALGETLSMDDRLLAPKLKGADASWDIALDLVASRFRETIATYGPDSVAFYVSGQLLTEDYYVANKLMKGFIGSANIDTNSRLCMASTVAGHKRAFGTDTVPGTYEDLDEADLIVLVGSNLAWCHPVLYQRIAAARAKRGTKVVVVDPRRTATCDIADMHLKIAPGSDVALFNGLLTHLHNADAIEREFVNAHSTGFEEALAAANADSPRSTGLPASQTAPFYMLFAATERVVTVFSQGINQSSSGTDKVNSILNCHLATGRIGRPGMGPLSVTGQPNAMGGREVGGLANMLAVHLDLESAEHRHAVGKFWDAPLVAAAPGLKAVDMFRAIEDGRVRALWIACTNPAVSMPEAGRVSRAIERCEFTVVSDITAKTDTARLADVLLPATGWGEKDGTVTNSDRTISRQRSVLPAPGNARPDWAIFAEVGRRMGWRTAFDFSSPAAVFREHAALSGIAPRFDRDFDISVLADISDAEYDALSPVRWPISRSTKNGRFFGDGRFFTANGKARLVPVKHCAPAAETTDRYPLRLNTGRIRDQWHTMTRTAKAPRLSRHLAEPFLQIHPVDAERLNLRAADLAKVTSPHGEAVLRVLISPDATPGAPFAPMHWTGETAPAARIGPLVTAATDPNSGQPESKASIVSVTRYPAKWYGFAVARKEFRPTTEYWARARTSAGWRCELAGVEHPGSWVSFAQELFGLEMDPAMLSDEGRSLARLAFWSDGALEAALFTSTEPVEVARDFVADALGLSVKGLLAARPGRETSDPGPTVCSCMSVGRNVLVEAIVAGDTPDVEAICDATGAGTSCGSCRPEIAALIERFALQQAAE
ncbi:MAG: molybdopterin-dependent oxidoreductase [Pseudomonadota bacterium]